MVDVNTAGRDFCVFLLKQKTSVNLTLTNVKRNFSFNIFSLYYKCGQEAVIMMANIV